MLVPPPGWRHHAGVHVTTMIPPGGGGRIRYHERLPLGRVSAVVRGILAHDPGFRVIATTRSERLATGEGEHAALVSLSGVLQGQSVMRHLGVVLADETAAAVDALVADRSRFAAFEQVTRELLGSISLGLGVRRRRFLYEPPAGWPGVPSGLLATWYAPEYPRDPTTITVHPATPTPAVTPRALFDSLLEADRPASNVDAEPFSSAHGLDGERYRIVLPGQQAREMVIAVAGGYAYALRLDTRNWPRVEEHRQTFLALAQSARRLPAPGERFGAPRSTTPPAGHWID